MKAPKPIPYIDPASGETLAQASNGDLIRPSDGKVIAPLIKDIPRFVLPNDDYAKSFGWQWNTWKNSRTVTDKLKANHFHDILKRTQFGTLDLQGKTIIECGMGAGDDTLALLTLPFSEVYSFDISDSVEAAAAKIDDPRAQICQASIYDIPYPDRSFDVVYCHRVLQHTPDPIRYLKAICKKVKPGGILFTHAYKRSVEYMAEWRYKYLHLTQRLPHKWIYYYVQFFGPILHKLNRSLYRNPKTREFAYNYIPFYYKEVDFMNDEELLDFLKLVTFDALTPAHDHPMSSEEFFGTIESEGFEILNKYDPEISPMWCTARLTNPK